MPSGSNVCNFSVATSEKFKGKDGQLQEKTEWHRVTIYGAVGDNCAKYLKKGQLVVIEGKIETRSWAREDGSKGYATNIIAFNVQFGPKGAGTGQGGADAPQDEIDYDTGEKATPARKSSAMKPAVVAKGTKKDDDQIEYPTEDINPDDIPF